MLVVTALVVLLGVGVMFYVTVREVDKQVDDVTNTVNSNFTRLRVDVQRQLDAIPQTGTVPVPTVTPVPTEAPTVDPGGDVTPAPTPTATVEGETTPDPGADSTPTPEEPAIINPSPALTRRLARSDDRGGAGCPPLLAVDLALVVLEHAPGAELRPERA
jgi:hypothetical protein